jgi:TIR domain
MKVFISWSGQISGQVAEALRSWLPTVIQSIEPWMSESDMNKGARWANELARELQDTKAGIICLTSDNTAKPWLLFEAGALSKMLPDTYVCPLLFRMQLTDIEEGPLTQFQATFTDKSDIRSLLRTISTAQGSAALPTELLDRTFDRAWPELEEQFDKIPRFSTQNNEGRSAKDMVREILGILRLQAQEFEARDDDLYRSRDSFLALVNSVFNTASPESAGTTPEVVKHLEDFKRHTAAHLEKQDITACPDCRGTGYIMVAGAGVKRCHHEHMENEPEIYHENSNH